MAKIFIKNKKLVVISISNSNYDEIATMLSFQWRFEEKPGRLEFDGEFDGEFIHKIREFISEEGESVELSSECQEILSPYLERVTKLVDLKIKGKNIKKGKISLQNQEIVKKLYPYQLDPVIHAIELDFSANFSVPGSGKTWMAYFAYEEMKKRGEVDKILIISPLSAFRPWEFEYQEIFGRPPNSYRIKSKYVNRLIEEMKNNEIFLVSYATAAIKSEFIIDMLQKANFLVVCDESHYIKNPVSKRSIGILSFSKFAKKRMILTGTPLPQGPDDLWSQFTFLFSDESLLGNYDYYRYQISHNNFSKIKKILEPFYTRIKLEQLGLPKQIIQKKRVDMSFYQEQIYNAIAETFMAGQKINWQDQQELDDWRTNITMYLLAAALDPSLLYKEKKQKIEILDYKNMSFPDMIQNYVKLNETPNKITTAIEETVKIVDKKDKVVLWCTRVKTIERMQKELKKLGYDSVTVTGKIPQDEEADPNDNREKRIEEFKHTMKNILIASPASCAESISLHKHCQKAIYLDRNFNGAQYMQSLSRIHRVGMPANVNPKYLMLMSDNSIDEDVHSRLIMKHQRMLSFLNDDFNTLSLDLDDDTIFDSDYIEKEEDLKQVLSSLKRRKK